MEASTQSVFVFKYNDKFYYLIADTNSTIRQIIENNFNLDYDLLSYNIEFKQIKNNKSTSKTIKSTSKTIKYENISNKKITKYIKNDKTYQKQLKDDLQRRLKNIYVKIPSGIDNMNEYIVWFLNQEQNKKKYSNYNFTNKLFENTTKSYFELENNNIISSTDEYYKIFDKLPEIKTIKPKIYTQITISLRTDISSEKKLKSGNTVQINDNSIMHVIQFNGNSNFFYFTNDANHTIGYICDNYIRSLNLYPNEFINDIEFQTYRSKYDNYTTTHYIDPIETRILNRSNANQNHKLNMIGTNYDWYNNNYNTLNSSTRDIGIGFGNLQLPQNGDLPHISFTKITFFYNYTLLQNRLLIRDNYLSLYTKNSWYNLIDLNNTVNFTPYGREEGIRTIQLYFRRKGKVTHDYNFLFDFYITDKNQKLSCNLFTDIWKNIPNITVALSDDSKYLGFRDKITGDSNFIRIGDNDEQSRDLSGVQESDTVYLFKNWYKQGGLLYRLEIHIDEEIVKWSM